MKKDRNMTVPYPIYPNMYQGVGPMPMNMMGMPNITQTCGSSDLDQRINSLEQRVNNLENMLTNTNNNYNNYNSSNYQML